VTAFTWTLLEIQHIQSDCSCHVGYFKRSV